MPSSKNPLASIAPGPGKLPADTVSASALMPGVGNGSNALIANHEADPVDAHLASAIGINPLYPWTFSPLISSAGGILYGESVLDFVNQALDLFPIAPNPLGSNNTAVPNSGLVNWTPASVGGAWSDGTDVVFTHHVYDAAATGALGLEAILFPADRGLIAIYTSTDGDFTNAGTTTLYAALWVGSPQNKPGALTCPSADFYEQYRNLQQTDYVPTGVGLDKIHLTWRLPALNDYSVSGAPYTAYNATFNSYQIAALTTTLPALTPGVSNPSWMIVHWKESYAVSDAAISPAVALAAPPPLSDGVFNPANAYSATPGYVHFPSPPAPPNYETTGMQNVALRYSFLDAGSATTPSLASCTATPHFPTTTPLSGVSHYDNSTLQFGWTIDIQVDDLFGGGWIPGPAQAGANLPPDFITLKGPVEFDTSSFGVPNYITQFSYYDMHKTGGAQFTAVNAPQPTDQAEMTGILVYASNTGSPHYFTPAGGAAYITINMNRPNVNATTLEGTPWLYNSWPQSGVNTASTPTFEPFVDERFRYDSTYAMGIGTLVEPSGVGMKYNSSTVLTSTITVGELQVIGNQLVYPTNDYTTYMPAGPNYAAVRAGDAGNIARKFVRVFDTGESRVTGKIRIRGLAASTFSALPFTGVPVNDHLGAMLLIHVPNSGTAKLDLGRVKGDPDFDVSIDYHGCQTGLERVGNDLIISYNTSAATYDNGVDGFPIVFEIWFFRGLGDFLSVDEVEWLPL